MSAGKPDPGVARKGALDDLRDDHWVVPIGRRVIEAHSNAYDFGALIANAATCARGGIAGRAWVRWQSGEDFKRRRLSNTARRMAGARRNYRANMAETAGSRDRDWPDRAQRRGTL